MTGIISGLIITCICVYAGFLAFDLWRHKEETKNERGNFWLVGLFTGVVQFFATFGISDFALSIPVYRGTKTVDDAKLPGTLVTAGAIPGAVISVIYISSVEVDMLMLIVCVAMHVLGTFIGVKLVSKLSASVIKKVMGICICVSTVIILVRMIGFGTEGGSSYGLSYKVLALVAPIFFAFGALNMVGFGIKAPAMALLLTMGMAPLSVLPVVLSCCTFGAINGGIQFVRIGAYQRKVVAASSIFGVAGVVLGSSFVKGLNTTVLQWVMVGIMVYTAWTMLKPERK